MLNLLSKLFRFGLDIYGNLLVIWTVKSNEKKAFLDDNESGLRFLGE